MTLPITNISERRTAIGAHRVKFRNNMFPLLREVERHKENLGVKISPLLSKVAIISGVEINPRLEKDYLPPVIPLSSTASENWTEDSFPHSFTEKHPAVRVLTDEERISYERTQSADKLNNVVKFNS